MISIIVPFYNSEQTIVRCIESILNQTIKDFELILVDDGSTDNSYSLCTKYIGNNVHLFKNDHLGVSVARNKGLSVAKGEYITFCDADDTYTSDHLEQMISAENNTNADMIICGFYAVDCNGNSNIICERQSSFISEENAVKSIMLNNNIGGFCWNKLFKRECIENVSFPVDLTYCEDLYFLFDAFRKSKKIYYLAEPLSYHYDNNDSVSNDYNKIISDDNRSQFSIAIDKILYDFDLCDSESVDLHIMKCKLAINYLWGYIRNNGKNKSFIKNTKFEIKEDKHLLFNSDELTPQQKKVYRKTILKITLFS